MSSLSCSVFSPSFSLEGVWTNRLYVRHASSMSKTCLIHMWDMTHSFVRHASYIREVTLSYVRHDSFTCETWLIHMWDMTHSHACETCHIYWLRLGVWFRECFEFQACLLFFYFSFPFFLSFCACRRISTPVNETPPPDVFSFSFDFFVCCRLKARQ